MIKNHHENDEKDETAWDILRLKTTPPWFWRLPRNFFITSILFSINRKREQPSRKPLLNLNIFSFYTYKWDSSLPSWSVCHPFFNKIHWTIRPKFKTEDWLTLKTLICENVNPSFDLLFLIFHDFFGFFAAKEKKNRRIFFVKDIRVCFLFCNQL